MENKNQDLMEKIVSLARGGVLSIAHPIFTAVLLTHTITDRMVRSSRKI